MLEQVVAIVISNAVLLGILAFVAKAIIKHMLNKDIEKYKLMLKTDLDKIAFEHQVRFSQLHEKRGEVIAELYELFAKAVRACGDFVNPFEAVGDKPKKEKANIAWKALMKFYDYFDEKRIFLNEDTCGRIDSLFIALRTPINEFSYFVYNDDASQTMYKEKLESWRNGWKQITETGVPEARKALETELRELLGVENGE